MTKIWRNGEVKYQMFLYLVIAGMFAGLGFWVDTRTGVLLLIACLVFGVFFWTISCRRYREIQKLSEGLDRILHGEEKLELESCREGDLEILRDEIYKMTVRLREQSSKLQGEKQYLADSLADISHQIRTPLTSLNLTVTMLQQPHMERGRQRELLMEMKRLLGRVEWLVESLLKLSKLDAGSISFCIEKMDLEEFLRQAADPLAIPLEIRGQNLKISVDPESSLAADRAWTMEAVTNVLKNCMEYNPVGETLLVRGMENPLYTEIVVEDRGPGISQEDLPHLFERFYRGKQSGKNSFGIGLALSRAILARENGTIQAENRSGGGSRFVIRLYKGTV